jgi:hypothetical protein
MSAFVKLKFVWRPNIQVPLETTAIAVCVMKVWGASEKEFEKTRFS